MSKQNFENYLKKENIFYSHRETIAGTLTLLSTSNGIFKATFDQIDTSNYIFRKNLELNKLLFVGTPFQIKVWQELMQIPKNETLTYTQLANQIGLPKSVRAVANAVAKNNIAYFVPCHRIIHKYSNKIGYAWGKDRKLILLKDEI